jgi:hypothetical protein
MPKVGSKSYPYTKAGYKAAAKARKKGGNKSTAKRTPKMRRSY